MPDTELYRELNQKAIEIILNFKPKPEYNPGAVKEILKLKENIVKIFSIFPFNHKQILEYRFLYNLSSEQISQKLGVPASEVEKIISDSIETIKKNIKKGDFLLPKEFISNIEKKGQDPVDDLISSSTTGDFKLEIKPIPKKVQLFLFMFFWIFILCGGYYFLSNNMGFDFETITNAFSENKFKEDKPINNETNSNKLFIAGSSSLLLLSSRWENAFSIENPRYSLNLIRSDSDEGINSLIQGDVDVANSSRPLYFTDINHAESKGIELSEHRVAIDALVIITNKNNPVEELSLDDLEGIFSGAISNWNKFSNFNAPIIPLVREKGSGTNLFVKNRVLKGNDFGYSIKKVNSSNEIIKLVNSNPGAISFVNSTYYPWDNDNVKFVKVKTYSDSRGISPFEGRKLNEEAMRYGDYPLGHYLYVITKSEPTKKVQEYLDWVLGKKGQEIVSSVGLVPVIYEG